ncbi:hypothetical protein [Luteimonas sp. FCS-9]|uniref:hypothetical protein n=1 Tax=Luteimonas sp. FCS-9 TaxID=1547516 RepID=UPI00063E80EF|nr:hypothetical protein [Luteimonas sp. FCS-9]KLI97532.1 hypothetical protein WQ56_16840 [Luteimonas sp. FCS-9]
MRVDLDSTPYAPPRAAGPAAPAPTSAQLDAQLRTLSILYHVLGALSLAGSLPLVALLVFGVGNEAADDFADPAGMGMIAMVGVLVLAALAGGALCIRAGLDLARRRRHGLCVAVAGLACLNIPLGTALGVYALNVLSRPDVRAAFAAPGPAR